ncbi:MAG: sulfite exporter TauE/SafE family protein [Deltaproteobacteria bacterium]|nr:sulfite exporter TauE/SafE family protein [Deltaproteobacteria bacterium]
MSTAPLLALVAIVLAALVVEASLGFGATVIAVALGAFFYPIDVLLPAYVPVNMLLSAYLVVRHHDGVDGRFLLRRIVPFMTLGLPVGLLLFGYSSGPHLKVLFGVFVVGLSALELLRLARSAPAARTAAGEPAADGAAPQSTVRPLATAPAAVLLLLGGVIHGAFGTGGPMAVYVAGRQLADKRIFRSTLSALWLLLNGVLVVTYALGGYLTAQSAKLSLVMLLPLVVGTVIGEWTHRRLQGRTFATVVFVVLLAAGLTLALRSR